MSELEKRQGTPACPRCKAGMKEVLWIEPIPTEPDLSPMNVPAATSLASLRPPVGSRERQR